MWGDETDYSKINPDDVEKQMEGGALIPVGFYTAVLNGASDTTGKESQRPGCKLTYKITSGPFMGREVEDTIWKPDAGNQAATNRLLVWKHRLGLIRRNAENKFETVAGKVDFKDCLDTPVIIAIKHEAYDKKDKATGVVNGQGVSVKLEFNGLHAVDDPKALAKVEETKAGKFAPAGGGNGETGGAGSGVTVPSGGNGKGPAGTPVKKQLDIREL